MNGELLFCSTSNNFKRQVKFEVKHRRITKIVLTLKKNGLRIETFSYRHVYHLDQEMNLIG